MTYKYFYKTPDGFTDIFMTSDGEALTSLWFEGSRDRSRHNLACKDCEETLLPIFQETTRWLDIYFSGKEPDFTPQYRILNLTEFRSQVMELMLKIPYGHTITYGDIAEEIARKRGLSRMSAQAVGGAVGWNPICLIIPCHRVVGSNGSLTGYGGGMSNKVSLLKLEKLDMSQFTVPTKGTAL